MSDRRWAPGSTRSAPRGALAFAALIAATLSLSACNTTDALTPQVDVGGGMTPSSPVTQADTERMASSRAPAGGSYPASGYGPDGFPPAPAAGSRRGPQNSLEAQARAIDAGSRSPVASAPLAPPPADTDEPPRQMPASSSREASTAPSAPATEETAATSEGTIRFLPIIGAPVQAVTPLSRQLGMRARAAGLTIRASGDASAQHILKGYLSAFADNGKVTVIYVWDVLDGTGARLHRIQGQKSAPGGGSDPWALVPATTMEAIAAETIDGYMEWKQALPG